MKDDVNFIMECSTCGESWDLDKDPSTCICMTDSGWHTIVEFEDE